MRFLFRPMASKVLVSTKKLSCAAKRMQRIMRKGSSEKVISGFKGVRITLFCKSLSPLKGSINSPKRFLFRHKASVLMVKSRRFWSSCNVPSSTIGFLESERYDSFRAPTNSTSMSLSLICAVPKFLKMANLQGLFICLSLLTTLPANSIPLPTTRISISFDGRRSSKSRTKPPIT
ncbi:MAG: hypothetical protein BWZ11_01828 [Bacteroidetes bacterium ADurb.BinA395]|nr:MAG: hypothetical protein BWZ11_01828 [Bacteroidetes bacterium ADurb.BinA395]